MEKVVKGGLLVDEENYRWEIKNFNVIVKNEEFLKMQRMKFEMGSNGVKSLWEFWFQFSTETSESDLKSEQDEQERELHLYYVLLKKAGYCSEIDVAIDVAGEDATGKEIFGLYSRNSGKIANENYYWTIPEKPELIDGTLICRINLKVFNIISPVLNEQIELSAADDDKIGEKRKQQFYRKIAKLENDKNNSDVKIISSDGQEFFAYRWILSEVSDVFDAMFKSDMTESETGVVKLNDISGTTVKLLLHFIYTGKVGPQWSFPGNVVELAYAADKYLLEDLHNYLDSNIGNICTVENFGNLLMLASKYSMEKATAKILLFIRQKSKNAADAINIINSNNQ